MLCLGFENVEFVVFFFLHINVGLIDDNIPSKDQKKIIYKIEWYINK